MSELHEEPEGGTALSAEEREGLIPSHVTLRSELNELEQDGIIWASRWALGRKRNPMAPEFGPALHKRMFGKAWRWAGQYRTSNKNIGAGWREIAPRLYQVLDDTRAAVAYKALPPDEIAVRFHHGLVAVHPFANGNGRWSRLMADLLLIRVGEPRFSWGGARLGDAGEVRRAYIQALKAADDHRFVELIEFARS